MISALAMSNVYIFSKSALKEMSIIQFLFFWFGVATTLMTITLFVRKEFKLFKDLDKKSIRLLLIVGLLEVITSSFFFIAIQIVENPAIVSFLANLKVVFVISLGFLILNERFNKLEMLGFFITLIGGIVLGYREDLTFDMFRDRGVVFIMISIFFGALSMVIIKKNSVKIPSIVYASSRTYFLFITSIIAVLVTGESLAVSNKALFNAAVGSAMGPFLAMLSFYTAIRHLEAGRISVIGTSKGIFVLIGAYFVFDKFPTKLQLIGGLTTIVGVLIISLAKQFENYRNNKKKGLSKISN